MKPWTVLAFAALVLVGGRSFGAELGSLSGDYVEARSASVFAGPCHYGGEVMSDGHEAIAAWHVARGSWNGVSLAGVNAVAVIRSDDNLGTAGSARTTRLYIDAAATPAQQAAFASALENGCGANLGTIASTTTAKVRFQHVGDHVAVNAPGVAALDISALPDRACCKQPSLVWYTPLSPVSNRLVGFTNAASCTGRTGGDPWSRSNENGSFLGTFTY